VIWTERAEADLDDIWSFTTERWNEEQADLYLERLRSAISNQDTRKLRAKPIDFAMSGVMRMREVRHFIYFRMVDEGLLVLRVLHDSMDETLHLP
jgi:toxin ParE1/3/4